MSSLSIKQVATLLKVTPQAIYKRINDTEGNNELINYIQTDSKGRKLVDNDGLEYLKQIFNKQADNAPLNQSNNELIEMLRAELKRRDSQIERLQADIDGMKADYNNQLKVKDEQIERSQLNEHMAMNTMRQQQQILLEAPRKSWFDRFKKNGPNDEI